MRLMIVTTNLALQLTWGQILENVALKKPALGDSMYSDTSVSQPRYAVDGRTLTDVWHYTCFHSSDYYWIYNPHWWIVDLLRDYTIWEVKITNRNIFPERLNNFTVDIFTGSQDPRTLPNWPNNYGTICHHQPTEDGPLASSETRTLPCASATFGRYVRVVKYGYTSLVMCEVGGCWLVASDR
ncbi:fucolectin-related protein [Elysia marginata]|uniref:Fucolectin-related protein n=1 Tax=Elysia marginata TaxID=1093978 RepID=A0AAV4FK34_9GAST|nr:fucolectin-related protein [Elysia marginata]